MPDTTARNALEYPLGADPVSSLDVIVQALAERVDALLGERGIAPVVFAAQSIASLVVVFPIPFADVPIVNLGVLAVSAAYVATMAAVSTTQMTITVRRFDGTNVSGTVNVHWTARENLL